MYIAKDVTPEIAKRQRIEIAIVRRVVKDALAAGYALDVDDGGDELAAKGVTTEKAAMDALLNTDEDRLWFTSADKRGWVRFVYGNDGWDVINDYSDNPATEALLAGALALAERQERRAAR